MTSTSTFNSWIAYSQPNSQAKLRLFCFPYAGGSAIAFRTWSDYLPASVEVCPIELPGRGTRLLETPFTDLSSLVATLADALFPYLDRPFAFFGHSMGGLISFELTHALRRESNCHPDHLFISGRRAPQVPNWEDPIHTLPEPEFFEELRRLNGSPEAVLNNAELMELLLPALRADFAVIETYHYVPEALLDCPITVFGGLQDREVSYDALEAWREQTTAPFSLHMLPGDHFFLQSAQSSLLNSLNQELDPIIRNSAY